MQGDIIQKDNMEWYVRDKESNPGTLESTLGAVTIILWSHIRYELSPKVDILKEIVMECWIEIGSDTIAYWL